jgi:hypothetical protein
VIPRSTELSDVLARPLLAQGHEPATAMTLPLPDVPKAYRAWAVAAFLLGTIARDALGDPADRNGDQAAPTPVAAASCWRR